MKASEMQGVALDWLVAKAGMEEFGFVAGEFFISGEDAPYHPSTNWAQGGPIIEWEKITLEWTGEGWNAYIRHDDEYPDGPTPLVAAMRCYVASKLGDEIEIPEELK